MMRSSTLTVILLMSLTGCPEPPSEASDTDSVMPGLAGTWTGELSCYEESGSSSGEASLTLSLSNGRAIGTISLNGESPSTFTSTAQLELWLDDAQVLQGEWSNCAIEGGTFNEGNTQLSCHFWHQTQDNGYVLTPNVWEINEDLTVLRLLENPTVESEAQKCSGDFTNTQ
jgi:hypothetical protein